MTHTVVPPGGDARSLSTCDTAAAPQQRGTATPPVVEAIITIDQSGRIVGLNAAAENLFAPEADVKGRDLIDVVAGPHAVEESQGLREYRRDGIGALLDRFVEITATRADGTAFPAELTVAGIPAVGTATYLAFVRDISARRRQDQRRSGQHALTRAIAESATIEEGAEKILRALCEQLDWQVGTFWMVDPRDDLIRCLTVWAAPSKDIARFDTASRLVAFCRGEGVPGGIWETGETLWIPDVTRDPVFTRIDAAVADGLHAAVAFPVIMRGAVAGAIELLSHSARQPDADLLRMLSVIGSQIGQFIERRQAEAELRERQARLELVLAGTEAAIYDWDVPAKRVVFSPRWKELRGLADDEVSDSEEEWIKTVHPDDLARVKAALQDHFAGRTPFFAQEYRIRHKDGHWVWILDRGLARRDENGIVVRMAGSETDITERKRAEEALRRGEERYRAVVESLGEMLCRFQADGTIQFVNRAYAEARDSTVEDLIGANFWSFIHEPDRASVRALLDQLTPESPEIRIENRFQTQEGMRWILWINRALAFDAEGHWTEAQAAGIDITDRKRAEEALREADRRKDEFLATLAHELRNPLAPLRNALEVIKLADNEPATLEQARTMMERQLAQMVRLIDDLLDLSRIGRGKIVLRKERLPLARVVQQAVETSRPTIEQGGHDLTISLPPERVDVDADATRLAQVFANLLNNAAKFTHPGGHIRLSVQRQGDEAVVTVHDNGVGIPQEMLTAVFEMFTQVDHSLERVHGGLGIGLSLVKRIVEKHGGTVTARSDGPGKGSEFIVRLPLATSSEEPAHSRAQPVLRGQGLRVLVVDDNRDAAVSLAMVLQMLGEETRTAHDGLEALEVAAEFEPDVILLDLGMPRLNGFDAARKLRERAWRRRPVLVALTGWGQEDDQRRSREAGFDAHVVKPVEPAVLAQMLAQLRIS
ncbi:MAG TPA: PAS domain S-box protein [Gemmatimonadaceae bacterium]